MIRNHIFKTAAFSILGKVLITLLFILTAVTSGVAQTNTFVVTKTTDPDPFTDPYNFDDNLCDPDMLGTLQWAIRKSNDVTTGSDPLITFNISGSAPRTISMSFVLPLITKAVTVDGTTQTGYQVGNPSIIIDARYTGDVFSIRSNPNNHDCIIKGLKIINADIGVYAFGVHFKALNNVISSSFTGIRVGGSSPGDILGNNINNIFNEGILVWINGTSVVHIGGTGTNEANTISHCGIRGIEVNTSSNVLITRNVIYDNPDATSTANVNQAIKLFYTLGSEGNFGWPVPVITSLYPSGSISGTSSPNDIIELFGSNGTQNANQYLQTVTANGSGNWTASLGTLTWDFVTATATAASSSSHPGNTSELSTAATPIGICSLIKVDQNDTIQLSSPANFASVTADQYLQVSVTAVPTLTAYTDNKHTLVLQLVPESINSSSGALTADWTSSSLISANFVFYPSTPLTTGTYQQLISTYVTASNIPKTYYWRVGIQYQLPDANSHQPVTWSQAGKFTLQPAITVIAAETYLTDNNAHTNNINWVYGVSYLDDGKISEGIAYIDGLGKSRQVQSKLQSDNKIMAVEAAYSEEGGGSTLTLPAPTGNEVSGQARFGYAHRFFDVGTSGDYHDFTTKDFDREIKSTSCNPLAAPTAVDPDSKVGTYYGSAGPDYVDNAEGYPYAYNVGYKSPLQRPMLTAGGVGATFKMTGGKEYKHFYGSPTQQELDRVFGKTLAPKQENINRTVTYDPNGVGYITYKDNESKVIATALTVCDGGAPSLNALDEDAIGMQSFTVHIDPLKTGIFNPATLENFATSKFFVPCSASVTLKYDAILKSFTVSPLPCKECRYDVKVDIIDESCGASVYSLTKDVDPTTAACSTTTANVSIIPETTITLTGPATYIINRSIKPHVDATTGKSIIDKAVDDYIQYVNDNKTTLLGQFTTMYNTEEKWYMLRKTNTTINNSVTVANPDLYDVGTISGTSDTCDLQGIWANAEFNKPRGIAKDENYNYYVVEENNNTIRKLNSNGVVSTFAGLACTSGALTDATGTSARFNKPYDIVYARPANNSLPGNLFVADRDNSRVRKVTLAGVVTTFAGSGGQLSNPEGLGFDPNTNDIYIASSGNHKIYKVDQAGTLTLVAGTGSAGNHNDSNPLLATFNHPSDVAVDGSGNIYVADRDNFLIRKISSSGVVTTLAGSGTQASTDGTGTSAAFDKPASIVVDLAGTIFVTDQGSNKIRRVNASTGNVLTIAGSSSGYQDGVGGSAKFKTPAGLYVDQLNLFSARVVLVADAGNNRIRTIREEGCSSGPCITAGTSPEYLWYADETDIFNITNDSPYNKLITGLDGDADQDGTPGNEEYKLTSVTINGAANSTIRANFIAAYLRQHQIDITADITNIDLYDVGSGSVLDPSVVYVIDDKKVLLTGESKQGYYLLKVTHTKPSCEKRCTINSFTVSCADQCSQQHDGLKAEAAEALEALNASTNLYPFNGSAAVHTLGDLTKSYFPLNDNITNLLSEADYKLYNDYEQLRTQANSFDESACVSLCNGTNPGPCETCIPNYIASVNQNMDDIYSGYEYLMNQWTTPSTFPFSYNQLMPLTLPTPNTVRAADADLFEKLSKPLFDYLVSKLDPAISGNPSVPAQSNWFPQGGTCNTCYAPARTIGSVTCAQGKTIDISKFPTILLPLLDAVNAQVVTDYEACLSMNGTATEQAAYLCLQEKNNCLASLNPAATDYSTEVTACNNKYNNCISSTPTLPTTVDLQRENMIRTSLQKIYPQADTSFIRTKIAEVKTATSTLSIMELEKYLYDYEKKFTCIADCENQFNEAFDRYIAGLITTARSQIISEYTTKCVNQLSETFDVHYGQKMYHYTLYNYDKGNNLVSTVPPEGVDYVDLSNTSEANRVPAHRMNTTYKPTSLYTITASSPDEGETRYLYDKAGRIRFSQSSEQRARSVSTYGTGFTDQIFSYTKYDNDMRVIETGEYKDATAEICFWSIQQCPTCTICSGSTFSVESKLNDITWPTNGSNTFEETYIAYDAATLPANTPSAVYTQMYLQGRVSKTWNENATTHYSYDAHGRVTFAVQEIAALATNSPATNFKYKTIDYVYTTKTSRVDQIQFQKGNAQEEFRHRYTYDDDQRLTKTEVSQDGTTWLDAAAYGYYNHGPLKNISYGTKIQDIDLVYNINGWLKGINHPSLATADDPGGSTDNDNTSSFCRDAFGMVLGYFDADFNRTSSPFNPSNSKLISSVASTNGNPGVNLYNGNISSWTLKEDTVNGNYAGHLGFKYRYDQLNRIKKEDYNYYTSSWQTSTDLDNNYTFDGNGNILTLKRQGTSNTMDDLTATYISGTNKLNYVSDAAGSGLYSTDIDNQSTGNYKYTAIGERAKDVEGGIDTITWTMYGKIKAIKKHNGDSLSFTYNASNQRVMKYVKPSGQNPTVTYYINDVQGNIMSNYTRTTSGINYVYTQTEVPIYGSKRIGIYKPNVITSTVKSDGTQYSCISCALNFYTVDLNKQQGKYTRALTKKEYELNDHLGNVHVTLRDRKLSTGQADLISYTNYYAYGTPLTGKTYSSNTYSAGYNGKYKDDEVFGSTGTFYDYGDRPLDTRGLPILPRPDAKTHEYPFWTPYQYSGNNPILFVDPDGQEVMFPLFGTSNTPIIEVMTKVSLENGVKNTLEVGTKISEAVTKTSETAAKTNELNKPRINQDMLRKGRATETEQLQRLGLEKNTKPSTVTDSKTGEDVTTIPDAVRPNGQTVEIKDVIKQSLTKQLRAQEKLSNGAGQKPQLYLPEGAKTSRPLENSTFDIQRFSPNTAPADNTKVATPNPDIPVSTPVAPSCPTCS